MAERTYAAADVCAFRFTRAPWAELSNFWPLPTPIDAALWTFATSEHLYQATKFPACPDVQARIAAAPTARAAAAIGRTPDQGLDPDWPKRRIAAMRWVLRIKRESNPASIDAVLARSADRPIVEVSTRDPYWGARPVGHEYRGHNVLGRLWMELRQQLRDRDPAAASAAWAQPAGAGRLRAPTI